MGAEEREKRKEGGGEKGGGRRIERERGVEKIEEGFSV